MAVPAVPRRTKPSQHDTIAVPITPPDDDELALAHTMMPTTRTVIASDVGKTMIATAVMRSNDSSLEIPIEAVLVDAVPRHRRQITVGDGVLERVPLRRMWILHAAVIVATLSIAVVALAAN